MTASSPAPPRTSRSPEDIVTGKDVLELLSSSMYVNPLTIYREYVQNATDAIDEASLSGFYSGRIPPTIEITIQPQERVVKLRDNGVGISGAKFERILTAIGSSKKRGASARGFRGVGRLAGLGYCQELIMRAKAKSEPRVSIMRWSGRRLKELLQDPQEMSLQQTVAEIVSVESQPSTNLTEHFFEVELQNVARSGNDVLLNEVAVADYLGQHGPIPFSPTFSHGVAIQEFLGRFKVGQSYATNLNGKGLLRPFSDSFEVRKGVQSQFREPEFFEIPAVSDGLAAVGWVLHSDYAGAIPERFGIKGLRVRVGNVQIGDSRLLDNVFPETRFNSWVVGEFHALSPKLVPNGRRDDFEQTNHYGHFIKELIPKARAIYKRCRDASAQRTENKQPHLDSANNGGLDLLRVRRFFVEHARRKLSRDHKKKLKALLSRPRGGAITYGEMMTVLLDRNGGPVRAAPVKPGKTS